MKSLEDILFESEKDSFKVAAKIAQEHNTQLVYWENGHLVKRSPTQKDLIGTDVKKITIPE
jgi:hypothetical protein